MLTPKKGEVRKPTKTISGITPVAVMLPPRKCNHGICLYCPSLNVPQSYTPKSPVVLRASAVNYDAYKQVQGRLEAFKVMNHPTDKIEIIIMGGTFLEYPKKFQYNFIKRIYDALNNSESKSLNEAQKKNETAGHRCVALCIETRPDVCIEYINRMREFGCTRVELGVQIIDDKIYKKINRGHSVRDVIDATRELKNAGFKVGYHIMPGLPGSNAKKDLQLFKKLFSDERFKPEQIKIYPCQVMPGSELEKLYWEGKYNPYSKEQIEKILVEMLKAVPRYCRVMRIMREIPPEYLVAGTTKIDLRKDVEEELRRKKIKLKEIRYREVGFNLRNLGSLHSHIDGSKSTSSDFSLKKKNNLRIQSAENSKLMLKITKYKSSGGIEYFLEIVDENDILFGLLRLRILKSTASPTTNPNLLASRENNKIVNKKANEGLVGLGVKRYAIIRELHVYGKSVGIGKKGEIQHTGLGMKLMSEAERIVKENGVNKLKVISGVGVREYYRKLGYELENTYMIKRL